MCGTATGIHVQTSRHLPCVQCRCKYQSGRGVLMQTQSAVNQTTLVVWNKNRVCWGYWLSLSVSILISIYIRLPTEPAVKTNVQSVMWLNVIAAASHTFGLLLVLVYYSNFIPSYCYAEKKITHANSGRTCSAHVRGAVLQYTELSIIYRPQHAATRDVNHTSIDSDLRDVIKMGGINPSMRQKSRLSKPHRMITMPDSKLTPAIHQVFDRNRQIFNPLLHELFSKIALKVDVTERSVCAVEG